MSELRAPDVIRHASAKAADYTLHIPAGRFRQPSGTHLGNESGTSLDFHDYRSYQPGDDLRRVDWGVYARSDLLVIRQFRSEVSPVLELLVDSSASMGLYQGKQACAVYLVVFLEAIASKAGWKSVLVSGGKRLSGSAIKAVLPTLSFDGSGDPIAPASVWPPGAPQPVRVAISDFLFPVDLEAYVGQLGLEASWLVLLQVLSESELEPRLSGGVRFVDAERSAFQRDVRVTRGTVARYRARLQAHVEAIQTAGRRRHAPHVGLHVPDRFKDLDTLGALCAKTLLRQGIVGIGR